MKARLKWLVVAAAVFLCVVTSLVGLSGKVLAVPENPVHSGDTLWNMAQIYYTSVLKRVDDKKSPTQLAQIHYKSVVQHNLAQQVLVYRSQMMQPVHQVVKHKFHSTLYQVRPGDTLWKIAQLHHISVSYLMNVNHLQSSLIFPGQKLRFVAASKPMLPHMSIIRRIQGGPPIELIPVYMGAGRKYGIPWTTLAAIHRVETNFSTGRIMSSEGAQGPMQFMPATFEVFGVTAPGQTGQPNINNVYDAIYSCAHMLAVDGYRQNPGGAIYQYNHSDSYVQLVLMFARTFEQQFY